MSERCEVVPDWVHVTHVESSEFREVYGFAGGGHGSVNLEGIRLRPKDRPSQTLIVYMHPASTLQLLPLPRAMVERGAHVLCAGSRYARNDTPLIMEKVLIDLGAYIRHAKEVWGYERVVLAGWSGGGSLSLFYQSQAERPTITRTPAGDPVDIPGAKLIAADAMLLQAAHISRAVMLRDWIDPSVRDEDNPDDRDPELDLYDPRNPESAAVLDGVPPAVPGRTARTRAPPHRLGEGDAGAAEGQGRQRERARLRHSSDDGGPAIPRCGAGAERPADREVLPRTSGNGEQRSGGIGALLDAPRLAVAVVD